MAEIQLHHTEILALKHDAHVPYEYFRHNFRSTDESYKSRLQLFDQICQSRAWNKEIAYELRLTKLDMSKLTFNSKENIYVHDVGPDFSGPASILGDCIAAINSKSLTGYTVKDTFQIFNSKSLTEVMNVKLWRKEPFIHHFETGDELIKDILQSANLDVGGGTDRLLAMDQLMDTEMLGDYGLLLLCRQRRYDICVSSPHEEATMEAMNSLGGAYAEAGMHEQALEWFQKHIDRNTLYYGAYHEETLISRHNFATTIQTLGDCKKALTLLEQNLEAYSSFDENVDEDIIDTLSCMGLCTHDLANYEEAIKLFEKALSLAEKILGTELNDRTPTILNNLANAYCRLDRLDKAAEYYERAITDKERSFGRTHPSTLGTVMNYAEVVGKRGDYQGEVKLLERALTGFEDMLGEDHDQTLVTMTNLASAYANMGSLDKGLSLLEKALVGFSKSFGDQHPHTLSVMINLASTKMDLDQFEEAKSLSKSAADALTVVVGEDHPHNLTARANFAFACMELQEYDAAALSLEKVLSEREKRMGKDSPSYMATVLNLAEVNMLMGKLDEAEKMAKKAKEAFDGGSKNLAMASRILADIYLRKGEDETAMKELDLSMQAWREMGESVKQLREYRKCEKLWKNLN